MGVRYEEGSNLAKWERYIPHRNKKRPPRLARSASLIGQLQSSGLLLFGENAFDLCMKAAVIGRDLFKGTPVLRIQMV